MIVPAGERTTEQEMQPAIIAYLMTRSYGWSPYRDIFLSLPRYIQLTPGDREASNSRAGELKCWMIARNAYRSGERSGLFVKKDGGLQLVCKIRK